MVGVKISRAVLRIYQAAPEQQSYLFSLMALAHYLAKV